MTEVGMDRVPYKDEDEPARQVSGASSLFEMDDAADEFFDVSEPIDDDPLETEWCSNKSPELCYVVRMNKTLIILNDSVKCENLLCTQYSICLKIF